MEILFEQLQKIDELLEQIGAITANQTTVLLQSSDSLEEQINMLEGMVLCKEELINELVQMEGLFDKHYRDKREEVASSPYIKMFKDYVADILKRKEEIQRIEQNNVFIMQQRVNSSKKQVKIPRASQEVAEAYKKQQTQS